MKTNLNKRIFVFLFSIVLLGSCFMNVSLSKKINQNHEMYTIMSEGQILYSPMMSTKTYLIENNGQTNNTWNSNFFPGVSVWWLGDKTILRTIRTGGGQGTGGSGGGVQKLEWDGTVAWDFRYNSNGVLSHHDVKTLPNGNILMIAWETKSRDEAIAAGRNPNFVSSQGLWPDHIIEVEPTGPTSGSIVWEWHVWDHLIQDYNPSKENYGVVADHPELVDINFWISDKQDLMHTNSIDYNEEYDQILISVCNFNEIWIIDHSTTTEEAAGHTGGNSGMGGDILYRWGNPRVYDTGSQADQKLFNQHDATWIDEGYPGEGNILVFNNGRGRSDGRYSSIDEITPPVDENGNYYLEQGSAFGPEEETWRYTASPLTSFYAGHLSGAQRLSSGNTFITNGESGKLFEVTPEGATVWEHNTGGQLFKAIYISPDGPTEPDKPNLDCVGSLNWNNVNQGETKYGSFEVYNVGETGSLLDWEIVSYPDWGIWSFSSEYGENLTPEDRAITVEVEVIAPNVTNTKFEGYITLENKEDSNDFDVIPVYLETPRDRIISNPLMNFLRNHPFISALIYQLKFDYT